MNGVDFANRLDIMLRDSDIEDEIADESSRLLSITLMRIQTMSRVMKTVVTL